MVDQWQISLLLEALAAVVAGWSAWRLSAWARLFGDPRLARMGLFFALLAGSLAVHAASVPDWELRSGALANESFELQDVLFWTQHLLLMGALVAGVLAYRQGRRIPDAALALAPLLLVAEPVLRMIEGIGFLYLFSLSLRNVPRRETPGAVRAAVGFLALLVGQSLFLFNEFGAPEPLGARSPYAEAAILLGVVILALSLPRGRPEPA